MEKRPEARERRVGTVSRGIRCPIIRQGDDLAKIVTDSVVEAAQIEGFELRDRDVVALTESIVARAQGNYASVEAIAKDGYSPRLICESAGTQAEDALTMKQYYQSI